MITLKSFIEPSSSFVEESVAMTLIRSACSFLVALKHVVIPELSRRGSWYAGVNMKHLCLIALCAGAGGHVEGWARAQRVQPRHGAAGSQLQEQGSAQGEML